MARRIVDTEPEELEGFGRRLLILCRDNGLSGPSAVVEVLYRNYYEIVKPGIRRNKHGVSVKDPVHDKKTLMQNTMHIQRRFSMTSIRSILATCIRFSPT